MTEYTPTAKEVREVYRKYGRIDGPMHSQDRLREFNRWLHERDARVRAEEREHVNKQIQNRLYDWGPDDREDGYLLTPATVTIRASDLNDIISGGDSNIRFSFTDEEWDKHISEVAAAAEQRGAVKELKQLLQELMEGEFQVGHHAGLHTASTIISARLIELLVSADQIEQEGDDA